MIDDRDIYGIVQHATVRIQFSENSEPKSDIRPQRLQNREQVGGICLLCLNRAKPACYQQSHGPQPYAVLSISVIFGSERLTLSA
jgi:hypothetical protein